MGSTWVVSYLNLSYEVFVAIGIVAISDLASSIQTFLLVQSRLFLWVWVLEKARPVNSISVEFGMAPIEVYKPSIWIKDSMVSPRLKQPKVRNEL